MKRRDALFVSSLKGCSKHVFFRDFVADEFCHDCTVAEDIDTIAQFDLVHFGGIPDKGSANFSFMAQDFIDFLLGADINPAHGVVHQNGIGSGGKRTGKKHFLLIAAGKRQDAIAHIRCADLDLVFPLRAELIFARLINKFQ
ncbi:hypothetical protein D9M70_547630 [compost metagenome]